MIAAVVAPGVFDGFNVAHQKVIGTLVERAGALGTQALVLRLDCAAPEAGRLTSPAEVQARIVRAGADYCIPLPVDDVDAELARWSSRFELCGIVCGRRFDLSAQLGAGAAEVLAKAEITRVPTVKMDGKRVSTARVRDFLAHGDVEGARRLLGRPYAVDGEVIHGRDVGKGLGFPTVNLSQTGLVTPAPGVYAGWAYLADHRYGAAVNVPAERHPVEAHLLDFSEDVYGAPIRLEFLSHIRRERTFAGPRQLSAQIAEDVAVVRRVLAEMDGTHV